MSSLILASSVTQWSDAAPLQMLPRARKATRAMLLAESALARVLPDPDVIARDRLGLIVGTSHGELGATVEFFQNLAETNMARPILFQNSLHHSTLGYLSLRFGITGSSLTVSGGFFSSEDAFDCAQVFLNEQLCDACLIVGYDVVVDAIEMARKVYFPMHLERHDGAVAMLVANKILPGTRAIAEIQGVSRSYAPRTNHEMNSQDFSKHFEADGLARLHEKINDQTVSSPVVCEKPDGSFSAFTFTRL